MKRRNFRTASVTDPEIRAFIDTHRSDIYRLYDLPPAERSRVEGMFARLEELGSRCRNKQEFDEQFYNRTMSHELYGMILEFSGCIRRPEAQPAIKSLAETGHRRRGAN